MVAELVPCGGDEMWLNETSVEPDFGILPGMFWRMKPEMEQVLLQMGIILLGVKLIYPKFCKIFFSMLAHIFIEHTVYLTT